MKPYIFFTAAVITLFTSCSKNTPKEEDSKFVLSDTMRHMITIDSVSMCSTDNELTLGGEVSFNENNVIKIFPRSSGQLLQTAVSLGDRVHRGQVLAVIRSADVAGSYSDLSSAGADVAIAKRQMENAKSLFQSGISSEREYEEAKENYQKALAEKSKVQSMISINGGNNANANGQYVLTSPVDGYVVEKRANAGDFIRADNAENIFTVSDLKNVWVYANVYESDIAKVKQGSKVWVQPVAYPDMKIQGQVDQVSQVLDPQSKAMRVRIVLDNTGMNLKPDMYVKVTVSNTTGTKMLCVPSAAVVSQDGKDYVVIYNSDDNLKISEIKIASSNSNQTFVNSGVAEGQKLITKNQLLIFNQLLNE